MGNAYERLDKAFAKMHRLSHLGEIAGWDQAAMMPAGGNQARSEALAELKILVHGMLSQPAIAVDLEQAEAEEAGTFEGAGLREMRRVFRQATLLPEALVEAKSLAGSRCEHAWRSQRPKGDWTGFLVNFEPVVELARQEAAILSQALGLRPYDALMDKFDPGSRCVQIDAAFSDLKTWLPDLIKRALAKQAGESVVKPKGPFPIQQQKELALEVMTMLGFDFNHGRLDVSTHPFCGGVPQDVRITTLYDEADVTRALMGVVHETGHARYEQGLPREYVHLPVGRARSMALHESQSLSCEMQLGAHPGFVGLLAPMLAKKFGAQEAFQPQNLARLFTRVEPGLIRVVADELTYPAHIILRYEIERALIEGEIEARDIPGLWDEKMMAYLGVDTRGNFKDGPMQDIHWTDGSFGYFPSYTLGAMHAAQFFDAMRTNCPDMDERIGRGDFSPVFDWLSTNIWSKASQLESAELVKQATGSVLDAAHFKRHLERRYIG